MLVFLEVSMVVFLGETDWHWNQWIGIKKILLHQYEWASLNLLMSQIEPKGMGCILTPAL